jgi:hypothetical protein
LGKRFKHDKGKKGYPFEVELGKGSYKWCGCGHTKKVPIPAATQAGSGRDPLNRQHEVASSATDAGG